MLALGMAGAMVTTHEISVMMWSFKGPKLLSVLLNLLEIQSSDGLHIMVLPINYNLILNLSQISAWSDRSRNLFFHSTGIFYG